MLVDLAKQLFGVNDVSAGYANVVVESRVVQVDIGYLDVICLPTISTASMLLGFISMKIDERLAQ